MDFQIQYSLDVNDVSHSFGQTKVIDQISFTVGTGEFKVLLGPNGAGKSTLFSLITGLYHTKKGSISIQGNSLDKSPYLALRHVGVVFQLPTLDLDLTVRQNLHYHASLHGLMRSDAGERMVIELDRLNMADRIDERVRNLNGGHRRRVEIARALLHSPNLLLLDEPTVGLDVPTRNDIVDHVHQLSTEDGIAVLWATHLIDEVRDTDTVIVLHEGSIMSDGSLKEVLEQTRSNDIGEAFERLTTGISK